MALLVPLKTVVVNCNDQTAYDIFHVIIAAYFPQEDYQAQQNELVNLDPKKFLPKFAGR